MTYPNNFLILILSLVLSTLSISSQAQPIHDKPLRFPFYIGVIGGYGSTTWDGLVPKDSNQNSAITISTPIDVKEGGGVWGGYAGYEVTPFFAFETMYMRYPYAQVFFDPFSIFSFEHDNQIEFNTFTETLSVMGKISLIVPNTKVRVFSGVGLAGLHRDDDLLNAWRLSPTFEAGFNYRLTDHIMAELAGVYVAGYGESMLNPTVCYFPFLYSLSARLAYFF